MLGDAFRNRDKLAVGRRYGVPVVDPAAGSVPSGTVIEGAPIVAGPKADKNGVYELDGARYRIAAGDPLPDGAKMVDGEPYGRAMAGDGNAPPVEGELVATEKASAKKAKGPSETADAAGPSETA